MRLCGRARRIHRVFFQAAVSRLRYLEGVIRRLAIDSHKKLES